jgi:hypothetical protein
MGSIVNFRNLVKKFLYLLYLIVIVVLLMEVAYRFQIIDFYRAELNALNPHRNAAKTTAKKTLLVFGDSFTVQANSWLNQLRIDSPHYRIINSAITGTSIVEASYIAPGRIEAFDPDIVIYQVYVGNDLLGITHHLNWKQWSITRNIYWWLSDRVHFLSFLNYRMGQVNWKFHDANTQSQSQELPEEEKFDLERYRLREKIYALGDPYLISNSVLLKNERDKDLDKLLSSLRYTLSQLKPECKVYLLIIPHKAQINEFYLDCMKDVGFRFDSQFEIGKDDYPFVEKLKDYFEATGNVVIINPLLHLAQRDSVSNRVYFLNDEHLSDAGQLIVKEVVLSALHLQNIESVISKVNR